MSQMSFIKTEDNEKRFETNLMIKNIWRTIWNKFNNKKYLIIKRWLNISHAKCHLVEYKKNVLRQLSEIREI